MKLSKPQLDILATVLGAIAGICIILDTEEVGNRKLVRVTGGIATVMLGMVANKPATASPTTEEVEESTKKEEDG